MHQIVYDEIKLPKSAKEQVDTLIEDGKLEVVNDTKLRSLDKNVYDATFTSLASVMIKPNRPKKNRGEVASIAMAKTKSIAYFATDEKDLQPIIDEKINTGLDNLQCIRIIDIIKLIRDGEIQGFKRKEAKVMWRLAGKPTEWFDEDIWSIEE